MKLGLSIGYSGADMDLPVKLVQRTEQLGYDSVWTAEAYGSDAMTPLAYLGAVTERCAYLWFVFGGGTDLDRAADRLTMVWLRMLGIEDPAGREGGAARGA